MSEPERITDILVEERQRKRAAQIRDRKLQRRGRDKCSACNNRGIVPNGEGGIKTCPKCKNRRI